MKRLVSTFLIVLSICSIAHATKGRVKGLWVNPIFYNDDYLITIFPHYLSQNMNNAYIDASGSRHTYSGGLNFKLFGNDVGLYINKDFPIVFEYHNVQLDKAINFYCVKGGFGLGFDIAMNYYHTNDQPPGKSLNETAFGVGGKIGYKVSEIDLGLKMFYAYGVSTHENVDEEKNKAFILKVAARREMFKTTKSVIYPAIQVEMRTYEGSISYPTQPVHENKMTSSSLSANPGIGLNYHISDYILVIAAASWGINLIKVTESSSNNIYKESETGNVLRITFPKLELGIETYLAKWLVARAGINKIFYYDSIKYERSNGMESELSYLDSDFSYSFGVGLQFGKYCIDWQICEDLLWNAPYIISGEDSNFASSLSMKFCFK